MKKLILSALLALSCGLTANAQNNVGINTTTPDASAALDIVSTSQGLLPPRMTMAQRNAISGPVDGLVIYQTDNTPGLYLRNGGTWGAVGGGGSTSTGLLRNSLLLVIPHKPGRRSHIQGIASFSII